MTLMNNSILLEGFHNKQLWSQKFPFSYFLFKFQTKDNSATQKKKTTKQTEAMACVRLSRCVEETSKGDQQLFKRQQQEQEIPVVTHCKELGRSVSGWLKQFSIIQKKHWFFSPCSSHKLALDQFWTWPGFTNLQHIWVNLKLTPSQILRNPYRHWWSQIKVIKKQSCSWIYLNLKLKRMELRWNEIDQIF